MSRFKQYINEKKANVTFAFWISPKGEVLGSVESHIQQLIMNADKFGLDINDLRNKFKEYGEPVGFEGKAREEIIKRILWVGWIRVRKYPRSHYSVNCAYYPTLEWGYLIEMARKLLGKGLEGFKESDPNFPVIITDLNKKRIQMTLGEIAEYAELQKTYLKSFDMLEKYIVRSDFWTMNLNEEVKKFDREFRKLNEQG
jgi:hypothetical protein